MPSTTNSGWLFPRNDELPLIVILVAEPGAPLVLLMSTPGTLPSSDFRRSGSDFCRVSSDVMLATEYPRDLSALDIPIAVTTTSSNPRTSISKLTSITVCPATWISCVLIPTELNTSVASEGTVRE